ncbi:enoyl-CoA hydratase-related protein [Camelimonas lactis]|uniref:Enoyl-CoA hydratase n=1 Tax=Camelimonas lactis TaxID=659006 RepID=A0A4R2GTH9_9HYPH|nr:enoyl-CoA hydratase-related protein [Camelimonas lactis]TCO13813.1 enoyl-CoA hydratase [Camelimonas lactis]
MSDTAQPAVTVEKAGDHIALVTINRPEARNAVNGAVAQGLEKAVRDTEADDDIWVVILTGAGEQAFCAGADLKEVSAGRRGGIATEAGGFGGFVHMPRNKVWIAAVNGFALAGGLEIMLRCDMSVASERAAFGLPEVMRGLVALAGGIYRLPRAIPRNIAMELIATGGRLDAKRAGEFGLVNRVVPHEKLIEEAKALAATICANAPLAVRESLAVARQAYDLNDAELRKLSEEAGARNARTEDYKEGPLAFVEKRAPRWKGR